MIQQTCKTGFRWEYRNCIDCGRKFVAKSHNSVRCIDCREKNRIKLVRENHQKKKKAKERAMPKENKHLHICRKIRSCQYGGKMGAIHICDYMQMTGMKRPCPAGECVVYKRKQKRKGDNI